MRVKKAVLMSALCVIYLYGANPNPQSIVSEVANLRQKYEECRQEQTTNANDKIKGYQKRISTLDNQIKSHEDELARLKKHNTELERELTQKRGVIQSLEKSLTTKDQKYRDSVAQSERFAQEANTIKVSKIERENLKKALITAKTEKEQLEKSMGKTDKDVVALRTALNSAKAEIEKLRTKPSIPSVVNASVENNTDQSAKIKALQNELSKANTLISQLQKSAPQVIVQEKIVTKTVEPTEKIVALQKELSTAQATIANLKKGSKTILNEKIVEKVVYKDRPVVQEKIVEKVVYKDRPVVQEKIVEKVVYRDRPATTDKTSAKSVDATEKLNHALQQKLSQYETEKSKLKSQSQKLVFPKTAKTAAVETPISKPSTVSSTKEKPSAYRMASNAPVYNAPGGSVVDTWEARRSFTSGTVVNGWVKITGYFVNRVWQRADQDLWVKESDVIKR
jgi:predicted  nucleic acid-binding Zn-ribbon protein